MHKLFRVCLTSFGFIWIASSCESGSWVENDESIGIFPDLVNNHIYQLVLWEKYYSFKSFGSHSGGGRNFKRVYYLVDYVLGHNNQIACQAYKLANSRSKFSEQQLIDKFCKSRPEFAGFLNAYGNTSSPSAPLGSQLQRIVDSSAKRQIHLWGKCGSAVILRNDDIVGKTNDTLFFYTIDKGVQVRRKLTIDAAHHVFDILVQNDSCFIVLRDNEADSLILHTITEQKTTISLAGPHKYIDISSIPDSIKIHDFGHLNTNYWFVTSNGSIKLLWLDQDDIPHINPKWMLFGFDKIWYINDGKVNYYRIPYPELKKKLAKLR